MRRGGLRFLAKIYQNLPPEFKNVAANGSTNGTALTTVPTVVSKEVEKTPPSLSELLERFERLEHLLTKILVQKRVKIIERDKDDLISKIVDMPLDSIEE